MMTTQERLAAIGFGGERQEPVCWRSVRIAVPVARGGADAAEPACSPLLLYWRRVLRHEPRSSPYRISRIER